MLFTSSEIIIMRTYQLGITCVPCIIRLFWIIKSNSVLMVFYHLSLIPNSPTPRLRLLHSMTNIPQGVANVNKYSHKKFAGINNFLFPAKFDSVPHLIRCCTYLRQSVPHVKDYLTTHSVPHSVLHLSRATCKKHLQVGTCTYLRQSRSGSIQTLTLIIFIY